MEDSKPLYPHHESLTIENFTCFEKAEFQFSPGINVFVGENGTGKTHVLKILYGVQMMGTSTTYDFLPFGLKGLFRAQEFDGLIRNTGQAEKRFAVEGRIHNMSWMVSHDLGDRDDFGHRSGLYLMDSRLKEGRARYEPVMFPAFPLIGSTSGFSSLYDRFEVDMDSSLRHLISVLLTPSTRELSITQRQAMDCLGEAFPYELELKGERFFVLSGMTRVEMPLIADGQKQLATLYRLIQVGALEPGTTLYWDEPEAHINPSSMDEIVKTLIVLARNGVQVFLATHSYIILKELDIQSAAEDQIKFFGFEKTENGTKVHEAIRYRDIKPNLIEDQYGSLLERAFEKDFKRGA